MGKELVFEIYREAFHIVLGAVIILIALYCEQAKWLLFFILIGGAVLSILSLYIKVPIIYFFLTKLERPEYLKTFPGKGALFYVAGCLLALKLFNQNIALASIAILAFGDSFSHLIGKIVRHKEKEVESAIAGIIIATIAAHFFVGWILAFIGACVAMAVEFIGLKLGQDNVDDNLFIPIVAGTIIHLAAKVLALIF